LKQTINIKIQTNVNPNLTINWTEMSILNEEKAILDNSGRIKISENYQNSKSSFKFTFEMIEKVFGLKLIDFSNNNWKELQNLIDRRNDVTHPKSISLYEITDKEHIKSTEIAMWIFEIIKGFFFSQTFEKWIAELETMLDNAKE
jgi:hypothetical protein